MSKIINATTQNLSISGKETMTRTILCSVLVLIVFLFSSCKKTETKDMPDYAHQLSAGNNQNVLLQYSGPGSETMWELQQARASTARYRNIENAIRDGYEDIDVVVQGMGHHFMKASLRDETFDIRNPEILVYNRDHHGNFELVAVEYAVPIPLSPDNPPAGFTGDHDIWDRNENFNLWLLHAWVWSFNPSGVFNPVNPLVHTH